jgi:folate-binding protein YgfZ
MMPSFIDVSGRAVISLTGPDSLDLLQRISTNDVLSLSGGRSVSTVLTNEKGRIVDVVSVAKTGDGTLLVLGQSTEPRVLFSWIEKFIIMEDIRIEDLTTEFACKLLFDLEAFAEGIPATFPSGSSTVFEEVLGRERMVCTLVSKPSEASTVSQLRGMGFVEASRNEFEEYRIINAIPAYPNELSEIYNPLEVNLSSLIAWTKGCYVGQEVIARLDTYKKVQRSLFRMTLGELPSSVPRTIFDEEGDAGTITSAVSLEPGGECHALGYVKTPQAERGQGLYYLEGEKRVTVSLNPKLT